MNIAICGAGPFGRNLGALLSLAGHQIVFGVRSPPAMSAEHPGIDVFHFSESIARSEVIVLAVPGVVAEVPLSGSPLAGRIVIDCTNLLNADWTPVILEGGQSNAERLQAKFPAARVVKGFNTVFADTLQREVLEAKPVPAATFLCGEDASALSVVAGLAADIGLNPITVGALSAARYCEALAHLHIQIATNGGRGTQGGFAYV